MLQICSIALNRHLFSRIRVHIKASIHNCLFFYSVHYKFAFFQRFNQWTSGVFRVCCCFIVGCLRRLKAAGHQIGKLYPSCHRCTKQAIVLTLCLCLQGVYMVNFYKRVLSQWPGVRRFRMANEEKITCFKGSRGSQFSPVE